MRRFVFLALALTIVLCACSPAADPAGTPTPEATPTDSGQQSSEISTESYTALKIGDAEICGNEYRYHYYSTVQSIVSVYGSYLGIDASVPYDQQFFDEAEGVTWADFFEEQTISSLRNAVVLSRQAEKEGMTLSPIFISEVDKSMSQMLEYCEQYDSPLSEVLTELYGAPMTEEELRTYMNRTYLGYQYQIHKRLSLDPDEDAVNSFYNENPNSFDEVDYLSYMFFAEVGEDGYTIIDSTAAEADSAAFLKAVTDADSFNAYISDVLDDDPEIWKVEGGIYEDDALSAWLFDPARAEGDKTALESDGAYYVLYFLRRYLSEDTALSIRHVLIPSEDSTAEDARTQAEALYEEWKKGSADEASFALLAADNSADLASVSSGGLYEDVTEGQMVEPFDQWCFDSTRQYGDHGLVDTEYGTHIMFYVGNVPIWKNMVKLNVTDNMYNDFYNALLPQYEVEEINLDVSK